MEDRLLQQRYLICLRKIVEKHEFGKHLKGEYLRASHKVFLFVANHIRGATGPTEQMLMKKFV